MHFRNPKNKKYLNSANTRGDPFIKYGSPTLSISTHLPGNGSHKRRRPRKGSKPRTVLSCGGREGGREGGIERGALTVRVAAEVTTKPPTAAVMAARKAAGGGDGEGRQSVV